MASQMWGETVRAVMDSGGWHCLQSVPNAYHLPADGRHEDDSSSICHGDDFLAEGSERTFSELDRLFSEHFEVTARTGKAWTNQISQRESLATQKIFRSMVVLVSSGRQTPSMWTSWCMWRKKRAGKPAVTPGTKASGMGARDSLELLSRSRAREVARAGGTALYLSSDRPDTMFASKTAMQHVSNPKRPDECQVAEVGSILRMQACTGMVLSSARTAKWYPRGW